MNTPRYVLIDFSKPRILIFLANVIGSVGLLIAAVLSRTPWVTVRTTSTGYEHEFTLTGYYTIVHPQDAVNSIASEIFSEYQGSCKIISRTVQAFLSVALILNASNLPILYRRGCGVDKKTVKIVTILHIISILLQVTGISLFMSQNHCIENALRMAISTRRLDEGVTESILALLVTVVNVLTFLCLVRTVDNVAMVRLHEEDPDELDFKNEPPTEMSNF
eukprot:TRINITY_DN9581_c0_g2_i1.p1 TRINITY_DN9581_c0_g2~~TRINITY_DN9581_c0_g2_i1.p1  ORF type:complete len:220 (+),score=40.94 TRINITY_DN9581_c0_g2_i1:166-825(+)